MNNKYGTVRIKKIFAFFPKIISTENNEYKIWWRFYFIKQRWTKEGSNRLRSRGIFENHYYDGWVTIGESLDKNVLPWNKYK